MTDERKFIVIKFGGTSVSSLADWRTIEAIVRERIREGLLPVVVCSALAGVSDALEKLLGEAVKGEHGSRLENLKKKHCELAAELGVDCSELLDQRFKELARLTQGAALTGEVSPRLHARVLAFGELLSTRLGAAFLAKQGVSTTWHDARESLVATGDPRASMRHHFLSAGCRSDYDPALAERFHEYRTEVVLTQGFIASNEEGDTVLLGRGGSDTSAAYFAAKLRAARLEIWTDVPGVFSANPRHIPTARLLRRLDWAEAQEIMSMGAKVLHPRCLPPVRAAGIPLHIRCTSKPDMEGTIIAPDGSSLGAQVKAVSTKGNITLISMETPGMWQQVGFLADVFACFKDAGLSIDLVSTSETSVTVSLDNLANTIDPEILHRLIHELNRVCVARVIGPCASVSLVGRGIRRILHQLGPALSVFEDTLVHLVSQSANDLNLTFVVDERHAERLTMRLHQTLFDHHRSESLLGDTWETIFHREKTAPTETSPWWVGRRDELIALADERTPLYVYCEETLSESARQLLGLKSVDRVFYSVKANDFPPILRLFEKTGLGFECVSPGEVAHVLELFPDIDRQRILFTPNFAPRKEYTEAFERGVIVTLDNLYPLREWPDVFTGRDIFVRIDPGQGRGHHDFVKTAGNRSKFGIGADRIDELLEAAAKLDVRIRGLHAHTGSGILTPENWKETAAFLASIADRCPDAEYLDVGGGLGVVEKPGQIALDLRRVDDGLMQVREAFPRLQIWMEPGRYLVAQAGALLARVTQTKHKDIDFYYVGVDAGMNSLIRPALYGAYHGIVNLSAEDAPERIRANIVGPICESGDVLGHERRIAPVNEGDVILIATVGAYGHSMSSHYNRRAPAEEVMLPARS